MSEDTLADEEYEPAADLLPAGRPYLIAGGNTGFLLLHGFTSMPAEMRPLADHLAGRGHTVLVPRLAGHGTHPDDLKWTSWTDWLLDVEDGLALLHGLTDRVIVVGLSMGGMIALIAASRFPMDAVVAMSTPYVLSSRRDVWLASLASALRVRRTKGAEWHDEWGVRQEADYPAYPVFPAAILKEIMGMREALHAALPLVRLPALLLHSLADQFVGPDNLERIDQRISAQPKVVRTFEELDHAMIRDAQNELVFAAIDDFVHSIVPQ